MSKERANNCIASATHHLEEAATNLANGNAVETAWRLRGLTDGMMVYVTGQGAYSGDGSGMYERHYLAGYEAARKLFS